jgi:integrase
LDDWNAKKKEVKSSYPNSVRINFQIQKKLTEARKIILDNEQDISNLDIDALRNLFNKPDTAQNSLSPSFFTYAENVIRRLEKAKRFGSATSYSCCVSSLRKYQNGKDLSLSEITINFLKEYEAHCQSINLRINSIASYMRALRAIINLAIDDKLLPLENYPFRKFKIKKEKTLKRAIPKDDLVKIFNLDIKQDDVLYNAQQYFIFMFNMRGMNFFDLALLKKSNIVNDRFIYKRSKTGKLYNIKTTAIAKLILEYYIEKYNVGDDNYIFPILTPDVLGNPKKEREKIIDKRKYFNIYLKRIAKLCEIETNLTSYVLRHSWASIAKFSGVSTAIIGESLGHSDYRTTETYLAEFEHSILDDANDLVVL